MKNLVPGIACLDDKEHATVEKIINFKKVIIRHNKTGDLKIREIKALEFESLPMINNTSIDTIGDDDWKEANKRYSIIKPLIEAEHSLNLEVNKTVLVKELAQEHNVGYATIYRWLNAYNATGMLTSLAPTKHSGGKDKSRLPEETVLLMDDIIDNFYANPQQRTKKSTAIEVIRMCKSAGIAAPHFNTVYNRIKTKGKERILTKRLGYNDVNQKIDPTPGTYDAAKNPLDVVQMDHTLLDIIVVSEDDRSPIGRPYITLAIDVYTRMVTGFYISLDPPGALGTGICLSNSILPKEDICSKYQLKSEWPIWGVMRNVHLDNAKEFKGKMIFRASEEYGFTINWRPKGKARYGAHIERLLGTFSKKIHALPGTTFEDKKYRSNYNSEKTASMTLSELEKWLHIQIVDVYHNEKHSGIGTSPLTLYEEAVFGSNRRGGVGVPLMQFNTDKVRLDFLPIVNRTIQRSGVVIDHIHYYSDIFKNYLHEEAWNGSDRFAKRKKSGNYIFKRDPRDISKIYFLDEKESRYVEIGYADMRRPPMSLWDYRAALKKAQEFFANNQIDEEKIFSAYNRLREIEENSKKSKKDAKKKERSRKVTEFRSKIAAVAETKEVEETNSINITASIEPFEYDDEI